MWVHQEASWVMEAALAEVGLAVAKVVASAVAGPKAAARVEGAAAREVQVMEAAQGPEAVMEARVVHGVAAMRVEADWLVAREAWATGGRAGTATVEAAEECAAEALAAPLARGSRVAAVTAVVSRASAVVDQLAGSLVAAAEAWARQVAVPAVEETAVVRRAAGTEALDRVVANEGRAALVATGTSVVAKVETAVA